MTRIYKKVDLNAPRSDSIVSLSPRPALNIWETYAACSFDVVVYTGNGGAAYSEDGGTTFTNIDPRKLCADVGEVYCCDTVVIYIPPIDNFAWIIQTAAGNYVFAMATPSEVKASKGRLWRASVIRAEWFGVKGSEADYPQVALGDHFLYMTFNVDAYAVALRISLSDLGRRKDCPFAYFVFPKHFWMCPVQNTGEDGYFVVQLGGQSTVSRLRVFKWPERGRLSHFDVNINSIPNEDASVKTPDGVEWLADPVWKWDYNISGATRSGDKIWVAWNGGRKIRGQTQNIFQFPHIGMAIIKVTRRTVSQRYIWNPDFAFAWPSLATNIHGDVGLSFCWGGGSTHFPQYGVALLTGPNASFLSVSSDKSDAAGGHYTSIKMAFPNIDQFCASGFTRLARTNHPYYVVFGN